MDYFKFIFLSYLCICLNSFMSSVDAFRRCPPKRIQGGDLADENQLKYQISFRLGRIPICGGGIIGDSYVVTAAHCVTNKEGAFHDVPMSIVAGITFAKTRTGGIRRDVEAVYVPKAYQPVSPNPDVLYSEIADLAILKLSSPLPLEDTSKLMKLELPEKNNENDQYSDYVGKTAVIAGFGANYVELAVDPDTQTTKEINAREDYKLRYAEATVVTNQFCNSRFKKPVYKEHICAKMIQRDSEHPEGVCHGDSGSPLVYNGNTIIGVLSSSPHGCIENVSPAVYTKISEFAHLIHAVINNKEPEELRIATWKRSGLCITLKEH